MSLNEFTKAFYDIFERAMRLSIKARREGLLALEEDLNNEKIDSRDIFEYGLRFAIDGIESTVIRAILSNIINQEKDANKAMLKTIQQTALLSIRAGDNPYIMARLLNSYTDIPLNDPEFERITNRIYDEMGEDKIPKIIFPVTDVE